MKLFFAICALLLTGCSALLPEKYDEYNFLSSGKVSSQNYEIIKLFDTWKGPAKADGVIHLDTILNDVKTKTVIIDTNVEEYERFDGGLKKKIPYRILWKMNKTGELVDSMKGNYSLSIHNSGMIYYNSEYYNKETDYYSTWINNGEGEKKSYTSISDDENLTFQELDNLIKNAFPVDFTIDYYNKSINVHIRHKSGVKLIKSKKLYKYMKGPSMLSGLANMPILKSFKESYIPRFFEISPTYKKPKDRIIKGHTYSLHTEFFVKNKKHSSLFAGVFAGMGRSGWEGIGYFALEHASELLKFKGYAFNGDLDRYSLYHPIEKNRSLAIIRLYKWPGDLRPYDNAGVYVIRKKITHEGQ